MAATAPRPGSATDAISYADLYARWERSNWSTTDIDFTQDAVDWREKLTAQQRRGALWMYALFFHGEDSVADNLSPYIDAAPLEEQKYFLTTQQVDEARHSVFFHRFMREVVGVGGDAPGATLAGTAGQLTWGHRMVFSRLDQMADELRADRSRTQLTKAVTLYHLIVEASLAQPGQHMIADYLEELDVLPGFREGMRNVELDEQRHIGFGVKLLADFHQEDPAGTRDTICEVLREVLAWATAVIQPPGWDETYVTCFGKTLDDLGELGAASLEQKLRAVGLDVGDLPRVPMRMDLPPRERAARGQLMLRHRFLGPHGPVVRDPESIEMFFDGMARTADAYAAPAGTVVQWDLTDSEPWHLVLDGAAARAVPGRAASPDLTLRCSLDDLADLGAGRATGSRLLLRGRLRPRGDLRVLVRLPRIFG
ncbi:MAG TPA: ribonucleotide-diphosphate reductase subunit beta [Baekduia sp.]|nr:ribonucleotide-diphosphate reductase subunit beta [Baekduia sp.]